MYLLRRHAVGLAQRGAQQGLEVQVEAHGGLTVEISRTADARHLHQQVLETRPSVEVASRPAERERERKLRWCDQQVHRSVDQLQRRSYL